MGTFHKRMTSILSAAVISLSAASITSASAADIGMIQERPEVLPIKAELNEEKQAQFIAVKGIIESISEYGADGTMKKVAVETAKDQIIHMIVSEDTYFIDEKELEEGMEIVAFYDATKPVILIYPPQYHAEAIAVAEKGRNVKADRFDRDLVSYDGMLKLKPSEETDVMLADGTPYDGELEERSLIVIYDVSTRSIPAQTNPIKIIVLPEEAAVPAEEGAASESTHGEELNKAPYPPLETPAQFDETRANEPDNKRADEENVNDGTLSELARVLESVEAVETEEGHLLVPLRETAEKLGHLVFWRAADQTVQIGRDISIAIGERTVQKQSERIELETEAKMIDQITYVPVSFFEKIQ